MQSISGKSQVLSNLRRCQRDYSVQDFLRRHRPHKQAAESWYALVPNSVNLYSQSPAAVNAAISHWATQIQQDGSNSAFKDFESSIAAQHGPSATAELASNAAAQTKATGVAPWTPPGGKTGTSTDQYPGTNTKSGGSIIGQALTSPVGQIVEGVIAGAIDVVSDGALTPSQPRRRTALGGVARYPDKVSSPARTSARLLRGR